MKSIKSLNQWGMRRDLAVQGGKSCKSSDFTRTPDTMYMGLTGQLRLAESIKCLVWAMAAALSEQDAAPRGVTQPTEIGVI